MHPKIASALAASILIFGVSNVANAAILLDQDNLIANIGVSVASRIGGPSLDTRRAQTVTAGITGKLTRIDLNIGGRGNLAVELVRGGFDSLPLLNLDRFVVVSSSSPGFGTGLISVDVSALDFMVFEGQQFSILLRAADSASEYAWQFGYATGPDNDGDGTPDDFTGRNYDLGDPYFRFASNLVTPWTLTGGDRGFATFVDAAVIPEPATWAQMLIGFGVIGWSLRRPSRLIHKRRVGAK